MPEQPEKTRVWACPRCKKQYRLKPGTNVPVACKACLAAERHSDTTEPINEPQPVVDALANVPPLPRGAWAEKPDEEIESPEAPPRTVKQARKRNLEQLVGIWIMCSLGAAVCFVLAAGGEKNFFQFAMILSAVAGGIPLIVIMRLLWLIDDSTAEMVALFRERVKP